MTFLIIRLPRSHAFMIFMQWAYLLDFLELVVAEVSEHSTRGGAFLLRYTTPAY
jgi:hypothetical protein